MLFGTSGWRNPFTHRLKYDLSVPIHKIWFNSDTSLQTPIYSSLRLEELSLNEDQSNLISKSVFSISAWNRPAALNRNVSIVYLYSNRTSMSMIHHPYKWVRRMQISKCVECPWPNLTTEFESHKWVNKRCNYFHKTQAIIVYTEKLLVCESNADDDTDMEQMKCHQWCIVVSAEIKCSHLIFVIRSVLHCLSQLCAIACELIEWKTNQCWWTKLSE